MKKHSFFKNAGETVEEKRNTLQAALDDAQTELVWAKEQHAMLRNRETTQWVAGIRAEINTLKLQLRTLTQS